MKSREKKEFSKVWRPGDFNGLELLRADYVRQRFDRHTHEGYAVGVIESGALGFHYRGENVVAPAGSVNLAVPDEAHTGYPASDLGWSYRMFYLEPDWLKRAVAEMTGGYGYLPHFRPGVLFDDELARRVRSLHQAFDDRYTSTLEKQSRLTAVLIRLISRHAESKPGLRRIGRERTAVRRAREYIDEYFQENVTVDELADVAGLSPFHLIRVFRDQIGLPPHAYLKQVRVHRAADLLANGMSPADAAVEAGFVDQSHLTRHFKRIRGITPAQFRKYIQDR